MLVIVGSIEASNSFSSVMKCNGEKDCNSAEPQIPNKSDKSKPEIARTSQAAFLVSQGPDSRISQENSSLTTDQLIRSFKIVKDAVV